MTRGAIPELRKRHCYHGQSKDKAVPRTQKGRTFEKRRWAKPEGINGIRDRDLKEQLCLRKERTSDRILGKTIGLEIVKRTVGSSIRIRKTSVNILCKGQPRLKWKKRPVTTA
jgi:hypothetical protein